MFQADDEFAIIEVPSCCFRIGGFDLFDFQDLLWPTAIEI